MSLLTEKDRTEEGPLKEAWLQKRKKHVTSTDVPILFGSGYYGSSIVGLWGYKKDRLPEVVETERMTIGKLIEGVVIEMYERMTGLTVVKSAPWVLHVSEEFPWLASSTDASDSEGTLIEIKNHDGYMDKVEDIPSGWHLQCQVEMLVMGKDRMKLVALCRGSRVVIHELVADPIVQRHIIERSKEFFATLQGDRPPAPLYPEDNGDMGKVWSPSRSELQVDLEEDEYALCEEIEAKKAEAKEVAAERDILEAKLKDTLGYAEWGTFQDRPSARVTWKANKNGTRVLRIKLDNDA